MDTAQRGVDTAQLQVDALTKAFVAAQEAATASKRQRVEAPLRELSMEDADAPFQSMITEDIKSLIQPGTNAEAIKGGANKLKEERTKLEAQRDRSLGAPSGLASSAAAVPPKRPFADIVREVLHGVKWAKPSDVKLPTLTIDEHNKHHAKLKDLPAVPVTGLGQIPTKPSFLAYGLGAASEDPRVRALQDKNNTNPTIIFGVSGSGKTRMLLELLFLRFGWFLIHRGDASKNFGSMDVTNVIRGIEFEIGARKDEGGSAECRKIAIFGLQCVLLARTAVLKAWRVSSGTSGAEPTPEQWLWAQMHPQLLVPGQDIFDLLALKLYAQLDRTQIPTKLSEVMPDFDNFYICIDEAQLLLKKLPTTFESSMVHLNADRLFSRRSLLSPVLEAVQIITAR